MFNYTLFKTFKYFLIQKTTQNFCLVLFFFVDTITFAYNLVCNCLYSHNIHLYYQKTRQLISLFISRHNNSYILGIYYQIYICARNLSSQMYILKILHINQELLFVVRRKLYMKNDIYNCNVKF